MWVVPSELEEALYAAAREIVGELGGANLTRAIVDRSRRYTSDRDQLAKPADRMTDLAARAVFFTIADAMKVAIPIAELVAREVLPGRRPLRIVDLGAGCGAMTLGVLAALPETAIDVLAIDRDDDALAIAKRAVAAFAPGRATMTTRPADAVRAELPAADLVLIGSVLNELPGERALELVERALGAIVEDGAVIVVEPALRESARALHAIRDAVIARGSATVFAPCTRRGAPCPALADPDDWCHEDRLVRLPPRTAELARVTHLRDGGMKFSYLVLRKQAVDLVAAGESAWRVVSAPMPAKGKLEVIGCSGAGRLPLRLLKRHRAESNRAFERARRGDVVVVEEDVEDGRVEIRGGVEVSGVKGERSG